MTPKEKAKELVEKFYILFSKELENTISLSEAKECALIAVEEIFSQCWGYREIDLEAACNYWYEVKQEINNL